MKTTPSYEGVAVFGRVERYRESSRPLGVNPNRVGETPVALLIEKVFT